MKHFIAIESSDGKVIHVTAATAEDAYRVIGMQLYGMSKDLDLDTGNVDVDLYEIPPKAHAEKAEYLKLDD